MQRNRPLDLANEGIRAYWMRNSENLWALFDWFDEAGERRARRTNVSDIGDNVVIR